MAQVEFVAVDEDRPGPKWQARFGRCAAPYLGWIAREAPERRPSLDECRAAIERHMPELAPLYGRLCDLVGPDVTARRLLSMWRPPPLFGGCSAVVAAGTEPALIRNYDFTPAFFEGTVLKSRWVGQHGAAIAMSEGLSGVLDGMNEAGLAVALTFGGRPALGDGFSLPIILRYVLETCADVPSAVEILRRTPCAMVQNVVLLDRAGRHTVAWLGPDRPAEFVPLGFTTNHQRTVEWLEAARASRTVERATRLAELRKQPGMAAEALVRALLRPPFYLTDYDQALGTLYSAIYRPAVGTVEYHWPGEPAWRLSFDAFQEGSRVIDLGQGAT